MGIKMEDKYGEVLREIRDELRLQREENNQRYAQQQQELLDGRIDRLEADVKSNTNLRKLVITALVTGGVGVAGAGVGISGVFP